MPRFDSDLFAEPALPSPFPSTAELLIAQRKVEIRGGINLPGPHIGGTITILDKSGNKPQKAPQRVPLTGCGHIAAAEIPLDENESDPVYVSICLICDGLYMSPKYNGVREMEEEA